MTEPGPTEIVPPDPPLAPLADPPGFDPAAPWANWETAASLTEQVQTLLAWARREFRRESVR